MVLVLLALGTMYGIGRWYVHSVSDQPQVIGASFIPAYASSLGVDPQQTLDGMLNDLHVKHLRLVSYWDQMEPQPGSYDFSQLDWQFAKAEAAGAKITLSVGLRQPRWPECHAPSWVDTSRPSAEWQPQLEKFMTAVVNRYKHSPALQSYQIENEFFLKGFGICTNFERSRLVSEFNLVKKLDPKHTSIVNRSNNALGTPMGAPIADEYGVSIYRRVWDATLTHRYLEYPWPAWFYSFMGGIHKITQGRDLMIHEMQAEAWAPHGTVNSISLEEQNKSLDAHRLAGRFEFARDTGLRTVDMWGAEYWYYRQQVLHDPSLVNVARQEYAK
ncbi:MAG: hypothetical protein JWN82_199 [Candidatus Saccharibacteria bacterium]|nr:hypothetical protein [Candidatus Saccharibacteria bacterium]